MEIAIDRCGDLGLGRKQEAQRADERRDRGGRRVGLMCVVSWFENRVEGAIPFHVKG